MKERPIIFSGPMVRSILAGRRRHKSNDERKVVIPQQELMDLYLGGLTVAEIAKRYSVSVQPIKRILRGAGVKMRKAAPRTGVGCGNSNPAWKGGRRVRKDGYVIIWTPSGAKLEHRHVVETFIGRQLLESEVVHHKDGNKSNNCIENLEVVESQSAHALLHGIRKRETLLLNGQKQCTSCLVVKAVSEFHKTKSNRMGIQSWCRTCKNKKDSERKSRKSQLSSRQR